MSGEDELIRDVEEEVKRLLAERRGDQGKAAPRIYFFRSVSGLSREALEKALGEGAALISLEGESPEGVRRFLGEISGLIRRVGGSAYLIRSPSILVIGGSAKLELRE